MSTIGLPINGELKHAEHSNKVLLFASPETHIHCHFNFYRVHRLFSQINAHLEEISTEKRTVFRP